jgi:hypothetical protein
MHLLLPVEMHDYTWVQLLKDNPAWASVCTTTLLAIITGCVIVWQVFVMKAQARIMKLQATNSNKHEIEQNGLLERQNRLIRYQFEYAWLNQLNQERQGLLEMTRRVQAKAMEFASVAPGSRAAVFEDLRNDANRLNDRLSVLNVAVHSGPHDDWYETLDAYMAEVQKALASAKPGRPDADTMNQLLRAGERLDLGHALTGIQHAIEQEFVDFKKNWDAETK